MNTSYQYNKTLFDETYKTYKSHNEIEKRKAIKSETYPQPITIIKCLGKTLGNIIIDLIPKDILQRLKSELRGTIPANFKVKPTDMNIINKPFLNIETLLHIDDNLIRKIFTEEENACQIKLNEFIEKKCNKAYKKLLNVEALIAHEYEKETIAITEHLYNEIIMQKKYDVDDFKSILDPEAEKIAKNMAEILKASIENHRLVFGYHMKLARGELLEEYLNERCEMELQWEKAVKTLNEYNHEELQRLRKSLKESHMQQLADLKHWYNEEQNRIVPVVDANANVEVNQEDEVQQVPVLPYDLQPNEIDIELRKTKNEILIYKKRLRYVLNSYIDFIENYLQKHPKGALEKQLFQAKLLLSKLNKTVTKQSIENKNHRSTPSTKVSFKKRKLYLKNRRNALA